MQHDIYRWLYFTYRFTIACRWKSIYQALKKGWNETVWTIIMKDHWIFVTDQVLK